MRSRSLTGVHGEVGHRTSCHFRGQRSSAGRWLIAALLAGISLGASADPIRIGLGDRIASTVIRIAAERGEFDREELDVELVELKPDSDPVGLLADGAIELATLTSDSLLRARTTGTDLRGLYVLGTSTAADALVARRDISNVRSLRGKRVAVERDSAGELLLRHALQRKGRNLSDVEPVWMSNLEARLAFMNGDVDAAVLHQPHVSLVVDDPDIRILADASRPAGMISDLLVGSNARTNELKETSKAIIRAIGRTVAWIRRRPDEARALIAAHHDIDEATVTRLLPGIDLLDVNDNMSLLRGEFQKSFSSMSEVLASDRGNDRAREVPSANRYLALSALRQVAAGR